MLVLQLAYKYPKQPCDLRKKQIHINPMQWNFSGINGVPPAGSVKLEVCSEGCCQHSEHPDSTLTDRPGVDPLCSVSVIINY